MLGLGAGLIARLIMPGRGRGKKRYPAREMYLYKPGESILVLCLIFWLQYNSVFSIS